MNPAPTAADRIVQEISINAPAERVFDAFANPSDRVKWWGAEGRFKATHAESDLRPGGKWMMSGTRQDGGPFTIEGEYLSVERPALLVFTWLPSWQDDATVSQVRVDFAEMNGVTHVRLTHSGLVSEASRGIHRGWPQILGWLRAYVERS